MDHIGMDLGTRKVLIRSLLRRHLGLVATH